MPVDPNVRAIDLANGAALHEHGIQTTATMRLGKLWRGNDVMVGAKLTAATVPTDEYLSNVAHDRSDHRVTLLLQSRF